MSETMLESDVRRGIELQRGGRLADAEQVYREVLRRRPDDVDALHLLGLLATGTGRPALAVELIGKAIALRPGTPAPHINLGNALKNLRRFDEALTEYDNAIALAPDNAAAHANRATVLQTLGRHDDALASCDRAIASRPGFAEVHNIRGGVLRDMERFEAALSSIDQAIALNPGIVAAHQNRAGVLRDLERFDEALTSIDQAIALNPNVAAAHNVRGNVLRDLEHFDEALASFDTALALHPDFLAAHLNRAAALRDLGRPEAALASLDAVLERRPDLAHAHNTRAIVLRDLRRPEEALASCDAAIALRPDLAEAHGNLGNMLRDLGRFEDALASYDKAIALAPDYIAGLNNRGAALRDLGRTDEAIANYDRVIEAAPDYAPAWFHKSMCHLALGDYQRGWPMYEWRWSVPPAKPLPGLTGLPWLGDSPVDGKTILVHAEQGLGDTLQFSRYLPELARRARVVVEVQRPLVRLLRGVDGVHQANASGEPRPRFDAWIPMMSLPLAFGTTLESIPADPWLHADPDRAAEWTRRLATLPGRKIGLVWAGSPRPSNPYAHAADRRRSISLDHLAPLAAIPGISLISLQKGEPAAQSRTPPEGMLLHDWTDELDDFTDTAALVQALDLVISVDTSVVHLVGGLGKPVWVLNRFDSCWRWLINRNDSPWYPTARLFTQASPGNWASVIDDVTDALRAWV